MFTALRNGCYSVLPKAEKCQIYQEIGGFYIGLMYLQNSFLIGSISFKCFSLVLEEPLYKEIINATFRCPYIRLLYNIRI